MKLLPVLLFFVLASCSPHSYRYPCQDPANWKTPKCNHPVCTIEGNCPEDVLPRCGTQLGRSCADVYG